MDAILFRKSKTLPAKPKESSRLMPQKGVMGSNSSRSLPRKRHLRRFYRKQISDIEKLEKRSVRTKMEVYWVKGGKTSFIWFSCIGAIGKTHRDRQHFESSKGNLYSKDFLATKSTIFNKIRTIASISSTTAYSNRP